MAEYSHERKRDNRPEARARATFPVPVLAATLVTSLAAIAAAVGLPAGTGLGVALAVAVVGGGFAAKLAAGKPAGTGEARALLLIEKIDASPEREIRRPRNLAGPWATLYDKLEALVEEARTARSALAELERFRRQVELAVAAYGEGKDPLADVVELRMGPLRDLLEAAKTGAAAGPVVSRLRLGEEELVGVDGEPFPVPWPAGADDTSPLDPRVRAELRRGLDELVRGIEELASANHKKSAAARGPAREGGVRTPTQLVDAVVHTAADGIEDLAAGLMRANELAAVAERVTNRATLLALNAALEATRSGSEAFAAIAEETRRLAEFAREATDTISRLANEIEYKVGETIHAIHQASENAKLSLAALEPHAGAPSAPSVTAPTREEVAALLGRARGLRASLAEAAPSPGATHGDAPSNPEPPNPVPPGPASPGAPPSAEPPSEPPVDAGAFLTIDASVREDLVENAGAPADTREAKNFLLLEGLEPGARIAG